jgi:hypothetical protein
MLGLTSKKVRAFALAFPILLATLALAQESEPESPGHEVGTDLELGLQLTAPKGWSFERPGAAGERLRLVRRDGRAFCSLLVRELEAATVESSSLLARVSMTLLPEVVPFSTLAAAGDRYELECTIRAALLPKILHVFATATVADDHVRIVRSAFLEDGTDAPALRAEAELARRSLQRCPLEFNAGRYHGLVERERRVAFVATPSDDLRRESDAFPLHVTSAEGGELEAHVSVGDPAAALSAALGVDQRTIERDPGLRDGTLWRFHLEKARGVAYETSAGTVCVAARARDAVELKRIASLAIVHDPSHFAAFVARASEGVRLVGRARDARAELRHADAVTAVTSALALWPEDPDALELRAALRREEGERALAEGEAAYLAYAAPWTGEVLARIRFEDALAAVEAKKVAAASFRFAHAFELHVTPEEAEKATTFYASPDALAAPLAVLPGLARVRELVPETPALQKAEGELRTRAAEEYLAEGRWAKAREESRRARLLGVHAAVVDSLDKQAAQGLAGKIKTKPKKPIEPAEDDEKPKRRDRKDAAPVQGYRPLGG